MEKSAPVIVYLAPQDEHTSQLQSLLVEAYKRVVETEQRSVQLKIVGATDMENTISMGIQQQIRDADIIICNVSKMNANVLYELGMAMGLDKPTLILVDNETTIPFDLVHLRFQVYDLRSSPEVITQNITSSLRSILAFPDYWRSHGSPVPKVTGKKVRHIFVSYSHQDFQYLERVQVHLKPLERDGLIELWSDKKLLAGEKWRAVIEQALDRAAICILLISADFMASDFIINNELQPILKSAELKGTTIIPLICKPSRYLREPTLQQFQAINDPAIPLCKMKACEQEEVYEKIAYRVELVLASE